MDANQTKMNPESIRPYLDKEVNAILSKYSNHPYMQALLDYAFPKESQEFISKRISDCNSIKDFQATIIYPALLRVLDETTDGLTTSGFDQLDKNTSYLYISNHRDIVLDTSLTNLVLLEKDMIMTASAIGDNLVQDDFLMAFSKLNRNFLVYRSLTPREMLVSSKNLSEYIHFLIHHENRSVWLAQREGRTKNGDDQTQTGILKMLTLGKDKDIDLYDYLQKLKIVPLSISYELDPTDYLKMPALMANYYNEEYVKTKNEDFNNILTGVLGKKRRVHISASKPIDIELTEIKEISTSPQQGLKLITDLITDRIHQAYKLWPSNYIAYDLMNQTNDFETEYTLEQKERFLARLNKKTEADNKIMIKGFLEMYAYPVINSLNLHK